MCAPRAGPGPQRSRVGGWHRRMPGWGLFFSGRQRRGGWGGVCLGVWPAVATESIFPPRYPVKRGKLLGLIHPDSGFESKPSLSPRCSLGKAWGFQLSSFHLRVL